MNDACGADFGDDVDFGDGYGGYWGEGDGVDFGV
jgi:hypothetical protein